MTEKSNSKIQKLISEISAIKPDPRIEAMIPKPGHLIAGESNWTKTIKRTDDRVADLAGFLRWATEKGISSSDVDKAIEAAFSDLTPNQIENARHRAS